MRVSREYHWTVRLVAHKHSLPQVTDIVRLLFGNLIVIMMEIITGSGDGSGAASRVAKRLFLTDCHT